MRRWMGRLERAYDRIVRCSVVLELPHRHHRHGHAFHVRIELVVPERVIVVAQDSTDAYVAIAEAFHVARRQLVDHVELQRSRTRCGVAVG